MDLAKVAAIDLAEAAYDLDVGTADWLPSLLRTGEALLDFGTAFGGSIWAGRSDEGAPLLTQVVMGSGALELPLKYGLAAQALGPEGVRKDSASVAGTVRVLSDGARSKWPRVYEVMTRHLECRDALEIFGLDPDFHGVTLNVLTPRRIRLRPRERQLWLMLMVHLTAGHRLRRGMGEPSRVPGAPLTDLPHNAEALLDPRRFLVSEARTAAQSKTASAVIREAAVRIDKARGRLRSSDPEQALTIWEGLVRGRWSLVDWFDTDGRRYLLAKPNAPKLGDPRGLSLREHQVATYAARGESSKLIGYRFGISQSQVSKLLGGVMRKLGARNRAQLVDRMRGLPKALGSHVVSGRHGGNET